MAPVGDSSSIINPNQKFSLEGQSVEYVQPLPSKSSELSSICWFVIRATRGRARKVLESLQQVSPSDKCFDKPLDSFELYFPQKQYQVYDNSSIDKPQLVTKSEPVVANLLFIRTTRHTFRSLLGLGISGMTPYYDHSHTNSFGRNDYLVVPDDQMQSFRLIVESGQKDLILDQHEAPTFLEGDLVKVVHGPFAGVCGRVLKFKHQRRVFVSLPGIGIFGTAYIPDYCLQKI